MTSGEPISEEMADVLAYLERRREACATVADNSPDNPDAAVGAGVDFR